MSEQFIPPPFKSVKLTLGTEEITVGLRPITRRENKEFTARGIHIGTAMSIEHMAEVTEHILTKCVFAPETLDDLPMGIDSHIVTKVVQMSFGLSQEDAKN